MKSNLYENRTPVMRMMSRFLSALSCAVFA
jgi:hypothetical protein